MKVSIITTTFNSAATVRDTLDAVARQTYRNIEHVIIDGVSTDGTLEIVHQYPHIAQVYSGKDNGIYDALNKGIARCTGDVIGILHSDDFYPAADTIEKVVSLFTASGCEAVYGDLNYIEAGNKGKIIRKWKSGHFSLASLENGWMPPHPTFFVRRTVYEQHGVFNTTLKSAADYELMLRLLYFKKIVTAYLPEVMVHMRTGGMSNRSIANRLRAHREDYQAWRINGRLPKWYTVLLKPLRKLRQFGEK